MAEYHPRLPPIPSYLTGPLVDLLHRWARQLNGEAFISHFSGTSPNSRISGQPGDLTMNIGSAPTDMRLWGKVGPNELSTTSWVAFPTAPTAPVPMVVARQTALTSVVTGSNPMVCDIEDVDAARNYDPVTGKFTAPVAGVYLISVQVTVAGTSLNASNSCAALVSGAALNTRVLDAAGSTEQYGEFTVLAKLANAATVQPRININGGSNISASAQLSVRLMP